MLFCSNTKKSRKRLWLFIKCARADQYNNHCHSFGTLSMKYFSPYTIVAFQTNATQSFHQLLWMLIRLQDPEGLKLLIYVATNLVVSQSVKNTDESKASIVRRYLKIYYCMFFACKRTRVCSMSHLLTLKNIRPLWLPIVIISLKCPEKRILNESRRATNQPVINRSGNRRTFFLQIMLKKQLSIFRTHDNLTWTVPW